jgi:two-component system sensor histidine kinase RegB
MQRVVADCKLRATLRQHMFVRMAAIATLVAAAFGTCELLEIHIPLVPITLVALLLTAISAAVWLRLRRARPVTEAEVFGHILVDVAALTALLYLTGGLANPFAYCYLLFVLYAASVLPQGYGWSLAGICAACFPLLHLYYLPLPLADAAAVHASMDEWARVAGYVLLAGLVVWFALRLGEIRREHRHHVEAAAEEAARERYLLGLATLAAGTAHEMGTPLSTMSVVVGDLRRSAQPPADWKQSIDVLWQQIQQCKHSLSGLARASDLEQIGKALAVPARDFVEGLAERFRLLHPAVALELHCEPQAEALALRMDVTLEQALLSLLNNAAVASPETVGLHLSAADGVIEIEILDRGPGIPQRLRERLGRGPVGSRRGGHGLGLLIANSAIERLGGSVRLLDREGGGTCVLVELPALASSDAGQRGYGNKGARVAAA